MSCIFKNPVVCICGGKYADQIMRYAHNVSLKPVNNAIPPYCNSKPVVILCRCTVGLVFALGGNFVDLLSCDARVDFPVEYQRFIYNGF